MDNNNGVGMKLSDLAEEIRRLDEMISEADSDHQLIHALHEKADSVPALLALAEQYEARLKVADDALEYELKLAEKQIELLKLRMDEGPRSAEVIRPFASNLWKSTQRVISALAEIRREGPPFNQTLHEPTQQP